MSSDLSKISKESRKQLRWREAAWLSISSQSRILIKNEANIISIPKTGNCCHHTNLMPQLTAEVNTSRQGCQCSARNNTKFQASQSPVSSLKNIKVLFFLQLCFGAHSKLISFLKTGLLLHRVYVHPQSMVSDTRHWVYWIVQSSRIRNKTFKGRVLLRLQLTIFLLRADKCEINNAILNILYEQLFD